jgi:hypothetical protein
MSGAHATDTKLSSTHLAPGPPMYVHSVDTSPGKAPRTWNGANSKAPSRRCERTALEGGMPQGQGPGLSGQ